MERVGVDVAAVTPDDEVAGPELRIGEDVVDFLDVVR